MEKSCLDYLFIIFNALLFICGAAIIAGCSFSLDLVGFNIYIFFVLLGGIVMALTSILGFVSYFKEKSLFLFIILIVIVTIFEFSFALIFSIHKDVNDFIAESMGILVKVDDKETIIKIILWTLWTSAVFGIFNFIIAFIHFNKNKNNNNNEKVEQTQELIHSGYTHGTSAM